MARRRRRRSKNQPTNHYVWFSVLGVLFLVFSILVLASFLRQGALLIWLNNFFVLNFGSGALVVPFIFLHLSLILFRTTWIWSRTSLFPGGLLFFVGLTGVTAGGTVGAAAFSLFSNLLTKVGAVLFFSALLISGVLVLFQISFRDISNWWKNYQIEKKLKQQMSALAENENQEIAFVGRDNLHADENEETGTGFHLPNILANENKEEETENVMDSSVEEAAAINNLEKIDLLGEVKPIVNEESVASDINADLPHKPWQYPSLSLLSAVDGGEADRGDVNSNAQIIESTLDSFGIKARVVEINRGPSVTQYALEIAMGTKLSKITALATDLALALAAPTGQIRIEAPIAGKSLVGVEVPNHKAAFVTLRKMLSSTTLSNHPSKLAVALGIDVNGKQVVADICKMPHALIAGATGSGKSVGINSFLCSLLFRCSPEELRLILVDPKRVELTMYENIPHLLTPVIVDAGKVVSALKWACAEMDQRYQLFAKNHVRNIAGYNQLAGVEKIPNIVIIIDEFADIMMYAPNDVEEAVTRIAQMARAVGIHLILTTQRPSVNVITGLIKANIPTRIAFNVASAMDSRVILDTVGAEKLLGNGDMLYIPPDRAKPIRIQGTFVSDDDAKKLTDFLKSQGWEPEYSDDITSKYRVNTGKKGGGLAMGEAPAAADRDALFVDAARMFAQYDQASSSMIQRRLAVGYARAARILDQLCAAGLVGPANGSKPREVNREAINQLLSNPDNL
ncbi:MAG: DNA translocase FtsK [bacterium]|nr:DNA translocase FtsK [bacterium]